MIVDDLGLTVFLGRRRGRRRRRNVKEARISRLIKMASL
jgi:hypothetical protein